jgi:hypothetical protein
MSTPSLPSMTFSEEVSVQLQKSLHMITNATLINNEKIKTFYARSQSMEPDLTELATLLSTQVLVLEEKYKVLNTLVTDLYERLDSLFQERSSTCTESLP